MSQHGEYEDYYEEVEKAFKDIKKAEAYLAKKELSEEVFKQFAQRCRECVKTGETCEFYMEPTFEDDPCEFYEPFYDNVEFRIEEVELEE